MSTTQTPIRYPGGKTRIYPHVHNIMAQAGQLGKPYAEPFAGGAGIAIKLLLAGEVPHIAINDADRAVCAMWNAIVNHADELCEFIATVPLDIGTWQKHRGVYVGGGASLVELGKSAFYLNRTNISGILRGGPAGGREQRGRCKLGQRFNRETLQRKIQAIAARSADITLTNLDAVDFIDQRLQDPEAFAFFDPPYVEKGPTLYRQAFDREAHGRLAASMARCRSRWIMTYDASPLVDELYAGYQIVDLVITHTANVKAARRERLILGPDVLRPAS